MRMRFFRKNKDDIKYTRTHVNPTPPRNAPVYHPTKTTNLIEIKQKDIRSVPEVWYKGEKVDNLVDLDINWHTNTDVPGYCRVDLEYYKGIESIRSVHKRLDGEM